MLLVLIILGLLGNVYLGFCAVLLCLLGVYGRIMALEDDVGASGRHQSTVGERLAAIEDRLSAIEARINPPKSA
jgi:hypothetical protein